MTITDVPMLVSELTTAREHTLRLLIEIPDYGKPEQDLDTAATILNHIRVSADSRARGFLLDEHSVMVALASPIPIDRPGID